jgi:hypothetical protein
VSLAEELQKEDQAQWAAIQSVSQKLGLMHLEDWMKYSLYASARV